MFPPFVWLGPSLSICGRSQEKKVLFTVVAKQIEFLIQ